MRVSEKVSVLVTSSYIPTHPDISIIRQTLESLSLLGIGSETRVVVVQDGQPRSERDEQKRSDYQEYLRRMREETREKEHSDLIVRERWGSLSGAIRSGLEAISTEFVLVVQHDLRFVRAVDLESLINVMEQNPEIKHVRFNINPRTTMNWDAEFSHRGKVFERQDFLAEKQFVGDGTSARFVRTLAWSDNNYLCRVSYLTETIFPIMGGLRGFPEESINPLNDPRHHDIFGTYIWGGFDEPPVIEHLDGRNRGTNNDYDSPPQRSLSRQLQKHFKHASIRLSARVRFFFVKAKLRRR